MYYDIKINILCKIMYPPIHHFGFKCVVTFFMFAEYHSRDNYRRQKIRLLKNQKN